MYDLVLDANPAGFQDGSATPDAFPLAAPEDVPPAKPRDVFVFYINGAKVRAPHAAMAMIAGLEG